MNNGQKNQKEITASVLARMLGKSSEEIFQQLEEKGLITKNAGHRDLTPAGEQKGGHYHINKNGRYILWPENIKAEFIEKQQERWPLLYTATAIGNHFEIPSYLVNSILSELHWLIKDNEGWHTTDIGKKMGGTSSKDKASGNFYIRWPEVIINNPILVDEIQKRKSEVQTANQIVEITAQDEGKNAKNDELEFRQKFPRAYMANDGHWVRSKGELIIDNWLYENRVIHAYEKKLRLKEEDLYCDFYIPDGIVYVEYWGFYDNPKYSSRKAKKQQIYKREHYSLIELTDVELQNLEDILPRKLSEFGTKT